MKTFDITPAVNKMAADEKRDTCSQRAAVAFTAPRGGRVTVEEHPLPYDSGELEGKAVDDVLAGRHSLKSHAENTGLVHRTTPATVPCEEGHKWVGPRTVPSGAELSPGVPGEYGPADGATPRASAPPTPAEPARVGRPPRP
ncbi:hypothetical protein, partial [Streptomyces sp. NPDC000351]|uniref:hypothetical protein n=1 Tax=Streptomyces sp. NPDC000351 TaxID=3154250 RepID=UPI00333385C1